MFFRGFMTAPADILPFNAASTELFQAGCIHNLTGLSVQSAR